MKKLLVLYSEYSPTLDAIKFRLQGSAEVVYKDETPEQEELNKYNLIVLLNYNKKVDFDALCVHHSLLPSFSEEEPIKEAFLSGVKVTGITVYYTKTNRIIAQYPLFIHNNAHYDDLEEEIKCVEQTFYPLVIEKIIKDEAFESQALMLKGSCCSGRCSGCTK